MPLFDYDAREVDTDLVREVRAERDRLYRMRHWCSVCLGNLGPGSPCAMEPEEDEEDEEESDVL